MSSHEEIRRIALVEFATAGYAATSLHRIAELAGLSKSSVLYHFASKDALLESAIGPALDRIVRIIEPIETRGLPEELRGEFLGEFVDFLLEYRLEVHMFINQGPALVDVPVIDRANAINMRLAHFFAANSASLEEKMRFGIALGGAAYMLCTVQTLGLEVAPVDETRAALITIMSELLSPVTSS